MAPSGTAPSSITPADITIRSERPEDDEQIARVVAAAFGSPDEARLVEAIRNSPEYIAELSLIALVDGAVAGHVMISRCTLVDDSAEHSIVMLSPLAVDPDLHGRGIGGQLVTAATRRANERREPLVVLEGDPRYYSRFGFEAAVGHGITMPLPDWAPPEAAQVLRLTADDPALRGMVVYPSSFDVLTHD